MSDLLQVTPAGEGVEIHGPYLPEHIVTLDGYRVPYITIHPLEDGSLNLIVDHRFAASVSRSELDRWMPMLANAMAIAAGYACFGNDPPRINPFNVRVASLGTISEKPEFTVIDGDRPPR